MDTITLLSQMLILLAMMAAGMIAYRRHLIDSETSRRLSALVVQLFNPFLILSSASGESTDLVRGLVGQNLILCLIFFAFLALCAFLYVMVRRFPKKENRRQQLMILLPNVGFMGVPVVRGLFGDEYVIFVVFYMLAYNVIAYTYGIKLAFGMSDTKEQFRIGMLFNTGFLFTIAAVIIFLCGKTLPAPVATFCSYMGNCAVPLSMILIGVSLAQIDLMDFFRDRETWLFLLVRMLLIPAVGILISGLFPFERPVVVIFNLMLSMPVGSLTGMLAETYGHVGAPVNRTVAVSTIVSVVTIPLLSLLYA